MSVIEKLDSVLAAANAIKVGPFGVLQITREKGEALAMFLRDHGPAIRQAMLDAERYQVLRAGLLNEDWALIERLSKACPEPSNETEFDAAIDKARATGEGEGHD